MIDLDAIYTILAAAARRRTQICYEDLSDRYCALTKQWHEPLASWRVPLDELNRMLDRAGWPPLSAVVVLKTTSEPSRSFWDSLPSTAAQAPKGLARTILYGQLLDQVYRAPWPKAIPPTSLPQNSLKTGATSQPTSTKRAESTAGTTASGGSRRERPTGSLRR